MSRTDAANREPEVCSSPPAIQGMIFSWKGHEERAAALQRKLAPLVPVTVINSEPEVRRRHPDWIHLDDSAYFGAQWNRAMDLFDADVLFHIQADADSDEFEQILDRVRSLFGRQPIGIYEPNVSYTDVCYDSSRLRAIEPGLFEVPWTDCTCWFVGREVLRRAPRFDLSVNFYGWGLCRALSAICSLDGRLCVRDYNYCVRHPKRRGYPSSDAIEQLQAYLRGLEPPIQAEVERLSQLRELVRAPPG